MQGRPHRYVSCGSLDSHHGDCNSSAMFLTPQLHSLARHQTGRRCPRWGPLGVWCCGRDAEGTVLGSLCLAEEIEPTSLQGEPDFSCSLYTGPDPGLLTSAGALVVQVYTGGKSESPLLSPPPRPRPPNLSTWSSLGIPLPTQILNFKYLPLPHLPSLLWSASWLRLWDGKLRRRLDGSKPHNCISLLFFGNRCVFFGSQAGRSITSPVWLLKCRVGELDSRTTFPLGPAQSHSVLPPACGQGCSKRKVNVQSHLGEQPLGVVTLASFTGAASQEL